MGSNPTPSAKYEGRCVNFTDIDVWIGKTLFAPPIIKFCQVTGQTQFAVSRLFWFVAALDQLRVAQTLGAQILAGLFCVLMMLTASLRADMPTQSSLWFRMLALAFLMQDVVRGVASGHWLGVEFWILVLIAEYAGTIRTIPPSEIKRKAAGVVRPDLS